MLYHNIPKFVSAYKVAAVRVPECRLGVLYKRKKKIKDYE